MKVSQKPLGRLAPGRGMNVSGTAVVITCFAMGDRGTDWVSGRPGPANNNPKPVLISVCRGGEKSGIDQPRTGRVPSPSAPFARDARRVGTVTRHAPLRPPRGAGRGGPLGRPVESAGPHGPAASTGTHRRPREAGSGYLHGEARHIFELSTSLWSVTSLCRVSGRAFTRREDVQGALPLCRHEPDGTGKSKVRCRCAETVGEKSLSLFDLLTGTPVKIEGGR